MTTIKPPSILPCERARIVPGYEVREHDTDKSGRFFMLEFRRQLAGQMESQKASDTGQYLELMK